MGRVDYDGQFSSKELNLWIYSISITLDFFRPGTPTDNVYAESFNMPVRLECLGQRWFMDMGDAIQKVEEWRREHNEMGLHSAIDGRSPMSLIQNSRQLAEASVRPETLT